MTSPAAQALRNDSADAAVAAHEVEARAVKELTAAASILKSAEPGLAAFFDAFYRGAKPTTGDDIAATAARVAQDRGTTYILMGRPKPRSAIRRLLQPALPFRLLSLLPGVDLRIVADRTLRAAGGNGAKEEP